MVEKKSNILRSPAQGERLGQFAAAHFWISIAGAFCAIPVGLVLADALGGRFEVLLALIDAAALMLMLVYGAAGVRAARVCDWCRPSSTKDGLLAFLFPALIAWGWGSLVLCCCSLTGYGWSKLAAILLMLSFFAGFPSTLAVFALLGTGVLDGGVENMILCMLLVGGLPPALFLLGSILGSKKAERRAAQSNEETEDVNERK